MTTTEDTLEPLISGLPDDIALICLSRVPRRYHHLLKCVSKRWKSSVSSEEFLSYRRKHNFQESWIYAICWDSTKRNCCFVMDPGSVRRCWKLLRDVPPHCVKRDGMCFETVDRKLYMLGGCGWNEDAVDEVYCYDASSNAWVEAAPMPKARCYFVSATLNGTIFASDGAGTNATVTQSWDTYNSDSNTWLSSENHTITGDIQKSITLDSKIYTIHKIHQNLHYSVAVYDPPLKMWQHVRNNDMALCWRGPTVVVDGTLYMLDEVSGTKLLMWQEETENWVSVGRLSSLLTRPPCQLAAVGRKIFVVGKGLTTVVVDVDVAAKSGGMLVSSSLVTQLDPDLLVLACKTIAI